jgi:predicted RND superfamily exporter protein
MRRWAAFVIRFRWAVLAVVVAITVGLALAATRLRVEVDADRQLPQDHPFIAALNEVHRLFGDKNLVVVGLFPHDGQVFTPAFLAKLAEVTDRIRRIPGANPALVQSLAAPQVKVIRGTADGLEVERVMETPPVDQAGADAVRTRAFANDAYVGTLVAKDGSAAAVQASFELTPAMPGYRALHQAVLEAVQAANDGTFDVRLSGAVVFLSQLSAYTSRMLILFPAALLVIGLVHYDAFRTLQALFLPLLTALLAVFWALGLMGLTGVPLDPFNTTTPILILAVAAGHAVQVLKRFYEEYDRTPDVNEAIVASLERVGPVMLAAGTVAALSFCSLVTFRTASIRTFGLFTGFGILSAMAIEMTIIPAVRACLPAPRGREREREASAHPVFDAFLRRATRVATARGARGAFVTAALVVVACGVAARRLEVNTSLKREFSPRDQVRVEDASLNDRFAGTSTLILLVDRPDEGAMEEPEIMRAIWGLERTLEADPAVGKALSYVDFVRQMHLAMNADRPDAGDLPATRALTAQYLFLYSLSGGAEDFDTILDPSHRIAKVRLLVHDDSTRYGQQLIARAQDIVRRTFPAGYRVRYTGTLASTAAATEVMVEGKLRNILQIGLITIIVSALLLRSVLGGLLVAVPLALAVAVNFGVMGLLGVPLDTMTAAISAMAVGIGADYAMYVLFRAREELASGLDVEEALRRTLATSGKAVLFVSSAIALGYATLCLSGFAVHVQLGGLVALAMLVSSASALTLLPAVVARYRPSFLWAGRARFAPRPILDPALLAK